MCNHRVLNPGLPAAQFDSFDSDEDADDPIEDEHHVIFACSGYMYARQLFPDLFSETTSTVGHFLSQPNPNRVAKFLTWVRSMRLNRASSDGSASGPEQTLNQINQINQSMYKTPPPTTHMQAQNSLSATGHETHYHAQSSSYRNTILAA